MNQYNTLNLKLSNSQLNKLKLKNITEVTLKIPWFLWWVKMYFLKKYFWESNVERAILEMYFENVFFWESKFENFFFERVFWKCIFRESNLKRM